MPSDLVHFYSRTRGARKVIVVDLGFLGDTVHLLPALWELKAAYPEAGLHVVTSPVGAQVLQLTPWVTRAWSIELHRERRSLRQQWSTVQALRRERFDVAFNFTGADRALFLTALTGARWRVAYPGGRRHFWNHWLVKHWMPPQDPNERVFEQRRSMLRECGLHPGPVHFGLQVDAQAAAWRPTGATPRAIHVSPNSAKPTREWPLDRHAAMLSQVWARHPDLAVLISSGAHPRERERLNKLARQVTDARLVLLPPSLTIPQLAATLSRCDLHVGPDSGVLHLAVALGVPTVSFFREQGAYRGFMPAGPDHQVISMPCHCVDHRDAPCEKLGYGECFARIEPMRVAALVTAQLERLGLERKTTSGDTLRA